jgi:acyl carrier protein
MRDELSDAVRRVLREQEEFACHDLADDTDLFGAGLTSHGSVELMLALEAEFGVVFPDEALTRATFSSIGSIVSVLSSLRTAPA